MNMRTFVGMLCATPLLTALACGSRTADSTEVAGRVVPSSDRADAGNAEEVDTIPEGTAGLRLSEEQSQRLVGIYVSERDAAVGLRFAAENMDGRIMLSLADRKGRELIHLEGSQSEGLVLRHGALTLRMTPALVGAAVAAGGPLPDLVALSADPASRSGDMVVEGDTTTFAEVESRPELALLANLSDALGARGLTGNKVPAALPLHTFAMKFTSYSPALRGVAKGRRGDGETSGSSALLSPICTPGDVECCNRNPSDPGCRPEPPPPPPSDQCAGREPGSSGCFGMCGMGCDCWPNVCGDCCWHVGCAIHDTFCRSCDWLNPLACFACYGPGALVGVAC
jgi:hypothetical protein